MTMPRDAQTRQELEQPAEVLYDLFRCAPIPATVNDDKGKAAFFTRDAQLAQAKLILAQVHAAGRSAGLEWCSKIEANPLEIPVDPDWAHIYEVAWADYQQAIAAAILKRKEEQ